MSPRTIAQLRERAGAERYAKASAAARRGEDDGGLGHDLAADVSWDDSLSTLERIDLTFELFGDLPGYGVVLYAGDGYEEFEPAARERLWHHAARVLDNDEDWRADPLLYWLALDVFHGAGDERTREGWQALAAPDASERRLERLLRIAGDLPFDLKAPVYDRLRHDPRWHPHIAASLSGRGLERDGPDAVRRANELVRSLALPHPHGGFRYRGWH